MCLTNPGRFNSHCMSAQSRLLSDFSPYPNVGVNGPFFVVLLLGMILNSARAGHDESGGCHEERPNEDRRVEAGAEGAQCFRQPVGAHRPVTSADQLLLLQVVDQRRVVRRVDREVLTLALSHPPRSTFPVNRKLKTSLVKFGGLEKMF